MTNSSLFTYKHCNDIFIFLVYVDDGIMIESNLILILQIILSLDVDSHSRTLEIFAIFLELKSSISLEASFSPNLNTSLTFSHRLIGLNRLIFHSIVIKPPSQHDDHNLVNEIEF